MGNPLIQQSMLNFEQLTRGKRAVICYSWWGQRSPLLAHFLVLPSVNVLYYRVRPAQTLHDTLSEMSIELKLAQLRAALNGDSPSVLGRALAEDVAAARGGKRAVLFIDEMDRLNNDRDYRPFFTALVEALPDDAQIAFHGRLVPPEPWVEFARRGQAVVVGREGHVDDGMFVPDEARRPHLEVFGFGRGYALVNGQPVDNWDGALPRNLFFFFIDRPMVTRADIFKVFWPDLPVKEATNVFHVTKRKITERISVNIGGKGSYELTQYVTGFYLPSEKLVRHYDVSEFQDAAERADVEEDDARAIALFTRAIDLYRAPFLQTIDMAWANEKREILRMQYVQALTGLARVYQKQSAKEQALGCYTRALREVPEREDIHREVMALYAALGRYDEARAQYHRLTTILDRRLKVAPSPESRRLYETFAQR